MTTNIVDVELTDRGNYYDIDIAENGDVSTTAGFDTSMIMSLLCERRASPSEVPNNLLRRGWIGNLWGEDPSFEIGSKVWLYEAAKMTSDTKTGIKNAAIDGFQWYIDQCIATNIEVDVTSSDTSVNVVVTMSRPNGQTDRRYFEIWQNTPSS